MGSFLFLLLIIGSVAMIGVIPVFSSISAEKRPSPWVATVSINTAIEDKSNVIAATQTHMNVDIPDIPSFDVSNLHTLTTTPKDIDFAFMQMGTSEPTIEGLDAINKLLETTMHEASVTQTEPALEVVEWENIAALTDDEFRAIEKQFGEKVAKTVTCTPIKGSMGPQVMIGQFFKEGNRLKFGDDFVEIKGDILEQLTDLDREFLLVKGNFLNDGTFYGQHWEDPEMVAHGYSDFQMDQSYMIL